MLANDAMGINMRKTIAFAAGWSALVGSLALLIAIVLAPAFRGAFMNKATMTSQASPSAIR